MGFFSEIFIIYVNVDAMWYCHKHNKYIQIDLSKISQGSMLLEPQ